jgi:hypothetical protein
MNPAASWTRGTIVAGRFEIEALAGRGGMSEVFRARDRETDSAVAIKLLVAPDSEKQASDRFLREAELLSRLRHPNVVEYVAHGQTPEGQVFLAMEWLEGEDLGQHLRRGLLRVEDSVFLARKVAEVLAMLHERGVLHRDLKPSNLFLRHGELSQVVLLDFGIARVERGIGRGAVTRTGEVLGTLQYLSPEQARGERELGPATDIYALGCVLFECLTGRPPFEGDHPGVVLARILCDEAPRLETLRPDAPPALAALVARMLARQPEERPSGAASLLRLLTDLAALAPTPAAPPARVAPGLAGEEQRLVSVIMAQPLGDVEDVGERPRPGGAPRDLAELEEERRSEAQRAKLIELLESCGAKVEVLATGTLLALLGQVGTAAVDQAAQAARCALLIQEYLPRMLVALGMGRGHLGGGQPAGEAIERAARLLDLGAAEEPLRRAPVGPALLDGLTAGLLDRHFHVRRLTTGMFALEGERIRPDEARLLLGRPTPCVGREQQLLQLHTMFELCVTESSARAVLVTSPPGLGKSRLRQEFTRRLTARSDRVQILLGGGDPMPGEPLGGLLGQALRRFAGVDEAAPLERRQEQLAERLGRHLAPAERQAVLEFLGEQCGVPFTDQQSPRLRAARQDPRLLNERIGEALMTLLHAECAVHPVLLVLEDLHWSDVITLRLVDRALRDLAEQPFFVLALGRSEVHERFPRLWQGRPVQEMRLPTLSRKASERLVHEVLGREIPAATLERVVEQAGGNALFLEELIRAVAEGREKELPETVLAMLQARFLRLEPGARRVLRAASILGATFWRGGVAALLGVAPPAAGEGRALGEGSEIDRWLRILVDLEIVRAHEDSRFPGEVEYSFRHALLRDAAYSLLSGPDRLAGHRLAGDYLGRLGETDPMVLAEHYRLGGDPAPAAALYTRAAEQALAYDSVEALRRIELGVACGAGGETLGTLHAMAAIAHLWRWNFAEAQAAGVAGHKLLRPGSRPWYWALTSRTLQASVLADRAAIFEFLELLMKTSPLAGAECDFFEQAMMVLFALCMQGFRAEAQALLARLGVMQELLEANEARARGMYLMARFVYEHFLAGDPWATWRLAEEGAADYQIAGDPRYLAVSQGYVGVALTELGGGAEAMPALRSSLAALAQMNELLVLGVIKGLFAMSLAALGGPAHQAEALTVAAEGIVPGAPPNVWAGMSHVARTCVWLDQGSFGAAEAEARQALAAFTTALPGQPLASALLCHALLGQGRIADACRAADEGLAALEGLGAAWQDVRLLVVAAEAHHAAGVADKARALAARACRRLEQRAARIGDPAVRERYLARAGYARACELSRAAP